MDVLVQLTAGRGPEECNYAVGRVFEKFKEDAGKHKVSIDIISSSEGKHKGNFKSIIACLSGKDIEQFLNEWVGTIKWIEHSPYRPEHGRKNWFVAIQVIEPHMLDQVSMDDIEVSFCRAGGKGGQNVNKVSTAVVVKHKEMDIVIKAKSERSQSQNLKDAIKRLQKIFENMNMEKNQQIDYQNWKDKIRFDRGGEVKTFSA